MITCLGLSPALDVTYGVPVLTVGGIHRPQWKIELAGGKSLNVARALRLLSVPLRAIAPLGGFVGDELRRHLEADGIALDAVDTAHTTRRCVSVVDAATSSMTEFYEDPAPIDEHAWRGVRAAVMRIPGGRLVVAGSVPAAHHRDLAQLLADAAARGIRLALDLRGEALEAALAATRPDLVKVNRSEAEELVGPGSAPDLAARLRDRGAATAVVTDGAAGSVGADASGAWRVAPVVAGIYTVGAGDSFLAGLVAGVEGAASLPEALRLAAAVAAANTLVPGAAMFDPAAVPALAAAVDVQPVPGSRGAP